MNEDFAKEFKTFREQIYGIVSEHDVILRALVGSNSEKIISTFDDTAALKVIDLYPQWQADLEVSVGDRYQYNGKLYKCIQSHTTQADWTPDVTPAMWTVIDVQHAGTIDDPIPASRGMEYEYGLYYIESDVIYLCERTGEAAGGKVTLQYMPSELVGQYFTVQK